MSANLLVELFTEELPPHALKQLGDAFAAGILGGLKAKGLAPAEAQAQSFVTPRRLAVRISSVLASAPERTETKKLMPAKVAFDAAGKPTPALLKRLEKEGASAAQLQRAVEGNAEYVFLTQTIAGAGLVDGLQAVLNEVLTRLPIPKVMSYQLADGTTTVSFVRPVHGLVALHGEDIVPVTVLGLDAGRITHGHRFQGEREISLTNATEYEQQLKTKGGVIADFDQRRGNIEKQLRDKAAALASSLGPEDGVAPLLDEVTALVEMPTVYVGEFEPDFLVVPQECLILTMRANQKYFPLFDSAGKLTNQFLIVSNMRLANPANIVEGNQRVVRPRLADARFFFETDKKTKLQARVPQLASVTYHNKLGSQLERVERVRKLAAVIARTIGADEKLAERAALLAKADLVTNMVGEFPELQGTMGRYYALADGEDALVAEAIGDQYRIRFEDDHSQGNLVSMSLFIADRTETLVGIWGIGLQPTGDKDPFALRRAALGVISAFNLLGAAAQAARRPLTLRLEDLLAHSEALFKAGTIAADSLPALLNFVYERYRNQLATVFDRNAVDAVAALKPPLHEMEQRVLAVVEFGKLPAAASLAAANKRTGNILKKADGASATVDALLLVEPAEKALAEVIAQLRPGLEQRFAAADYAGTLTLLAEARESVDAFFNDVMVMAEDPGLRANRIALLRDLHSLMNRVADISKLST